MYGLEDEEGQEPQVKPHGYRPTQAEVDQHNVCHIPFRDWCPECVAGKAVNDPHYRSVTEEDLNGPPRAAMDYAYMEPKPGQFEANEEIKGEVEAGETPEEEEVRKKGMPILVAKHGLLNTAKT